MQTLSQASSGLAQKMYEAEAAQAASAEGGAEGDAGATDSDAVDAEFEEVKDEDSK